MKRLTTITILSALAALSLAACTDDPATRETAREVGNDEAAAGPAADRDRRLPPRPRRLGPPTDDARPRRGWAADGERPGRAEMRARHEERRQELLDTFDADHDGQLSEAERTAMHEARVAERVERLDADKDGKLSPAELAELPGRGRRPAPDFATLDVDKDGFVTVEELAKHRPPRGPRGFGGRGPGGFGPPDEAPAPSTAPAPGAAPTKE